jgi:bacitracin transport system ATP-binding protein
LNRERGVTILISSHLLSEIEQKVTKIGIIHKGRLLEEIDFKELQRKNRKYIKLKVSDDSKACYLLENKLNINDFDVIEKGCLRVYENLDKGAEIAKTLITNDINLYEMHTSVDNLEDYFVRMTGGNV